MDAWDAVSDDRHLLADLLASLVAEEWSAPSLCSDCAVGAVMMSRPVVGAVSDARPCDVVRAAVELIMPEVPRWRPIRQRPPRQRLESPEIAA